MDDLREGAGLRLQDRLGTPSYLACLLASRGPLPPSRFSHPSPETVRGRMVGVGILISLFFFFFFFVSGRMSEVRLLLLLFLFVLLEGAVREGDGQVESGEGWVGLVLVFLFCFVLFCFVLFFILGGYFFLRRAGCPTCVRACVFFLGGKQSRECSVGWVGGRGRSSLAVIVDVVGLVNHPDGRTERAMKADWLR